MVALELDFAHNLCVIATMTSNPPRHRKYSTAFGQAKQAQAALHQSGLLLKDDLVSATDQLLRARIASGIAALYRAWCDLEERKRILKMKPLPKSVDTEKLKADKARRRTKVTRPFAEKLDPTPNADTTADTKVESGTETRKPEGTDRDAA